MGFFYRFVYNAEIDDFLHIMQDFIRDELKLFALDRHIDWLRSIDQDYDMNDYFNDVCGFFQELDINGFYYLGLLSTFNYLTLVD